MIRSFALLVMPCVVITPWQTSVAGVPEWLQEAARLPVSEQPEEMDAVCLTTQRLVEVSHQGEVKIRSRCAYRILRPEGISVRAKVEVYFDSEERLTYLKGWCLPVGEEPREVEEDDAIEASVLSGMLHRDLRQKTLRIPGAEPGDVVGYEYETKGRPFLLEDVWHFADTVPVLGGRYVLELPEDWEFVTYWLHHPERRPESLSDNRWEWELGTVPAVAVEPHMPSLWGVAAGLLVRFRTDAPGSRGASHSSWEEVGRWCAALVRERRRSTPAIQRKVAELTSDAADVLEKLESLTGFVQRDIRYVAVEIGIGGYRPHAPREVFEKGYGDCKDKALLLSVMLEEIGIDSRLVLINTDRGVVAPELPSARSFNHVILAIRLPEGLQEEEFHASVTNERLGRLLFFDPTDPMTPLGDLPTPLQANRGLVVTDDGGVLLELPFPPPAASGVERSGRFELSTKGRLSGEVRVTHWGAAAVRARATLLRMSARERSGLLDEFLGTNLTCFKVQSYSPGELHASGDTLTVRYSFVADEYAQAAGNLLLVRPLVVAQREHDSIEIDDERVHPIELAETFLHRDISEIRLPEGYDVDEAPHPVEVHTVFADYMSETAVEGDVLRCSRTHVVKSLRVGIDQLDALRDLLRTMAADDRVLAVLRKEP